MKQLAYIKSSNGSHWVGDGFPVQSIFSYQDIAADISPFILMDHAGPAQFGPTSQPRGVGQHPHRGFETVTLVYAGGVAHRDSSGGGGVIGPGEVQWMTAGAGVVHEEFHSPEFCKTGGELEMVQLWVNLPASHKMTAPTYQAITRNTIPELPLPQGLGVLRLIAGQVDLPGAPPSQGPARTFTPMNMWDLRIQNAGELSLPVPEGHTCLLYVVQGEVALAGGTAIQAHRMAVMQTQGNLLTCTAQAGSKLLVLTGQPLNEPVVGHGPFVMNSREEIIQAMKDYQSGQFGQIAPV